MKTIIYLMKEMGITIIKLKRLLLTGGCHSSATSLAMLETTKREMSMDQICTELNIRPASFYTNISYSKDAYNFSESSLCVYQNVRHLKRKKTVQ